MSPRKPESDPEHVDAAAQDLDALQHLDRVFDHRVRLALCVLLSRYDTLSFRRLKDLLGETDGSLGAHLRKLEDLSYVRVRKEFRQRKPISWYSLTARGRRALRDHIHALHSLLPPVPDERE